MLPKQDGIVFACGLAVELAGRQQAQHQALVVVRVDNSQRAGLPLLLAQQRQLTFRRPFLPQHQPFCQEAIRLSAARLLLRKAARVDCKQRARLQTAALVRRLAVLAILCALAATAAMEFRRHNRVAVAVALAATAQARMAQAQRQAVRQQITVVLAAQEFRQRTRVMLAATTAVVVLAACLAARRIELVAMVVLDSL